MDIPHTGQDVAVVNFDGKKYRLMGGRRRYYLSQSTRNSERKKPKGLHVAIWEKANGRSVPAGHVIHHKDHNHFNNNPANLECMASKQHWDEHRDRGKWTKPDGTSYITHLAKVRHMTKAWHTSEQGRRWHAEHSSQPKRRDKPCVCVVCGCSFLSKRITSTICSRKCQFQKVKHKGSATFTCVICASTFVRHGYRNPKTPPSSCSRRCRYALSVQRRLVEPV